MASFVLSDQEITKLAEELAERELFAERIAEILAGRISAESDSWMDAKGAAHYLGLSLHALHKLSAARAIPFEQSGPHCKLWFRRCELDRWRQEAEPPQT